MSNRLGESFPAPHFFSPQDRKDIASGNWKPSAQPARETRNQHPVDLKERGFALGCYITEVTCAECHGPRLEGDPKAPMGRTPKLDRRRRVLTRPVFFMCSRIGGIPANNRKINPVMAGVSRTRFAHFTSHERDALYAYLKARAEQQ